MATTYSERERNLVGAYEIVAQMHNALGITEAVEPIVRTYSGWHLFFAGTPATPERDTRPHSVLFAGRFVAALRAQIRDPDVLALRPNIGSVNQFMVESSDALQTVDLARSFAQHLTA